VAFLLDKLEDDTTYKAKAFVKVWDHDFVMETMTFPDDRWVDLGLPSGILWAAYNVGATSPEEYGGYYAWGETEEKSEYSEDNYNWNIGPDIIGTQFDVAHVKWGDGARMPSVDEIIELINLCDWDAVSYMGITGMQVTGPNGNWIFVPFAGIQEDGGLEGDGIETYLWSSTFIEVDNGEDAFALFCYYDFDGSSIDRDILADGLGRCLGASVRPVKDKPVK
jgi:hypothetical protein